MSRLADLIMPSFNEDKDNGRLEFFRIAGKAGVRYYLFLPQSLSRQTRVTVCIHGISRNAQQQVNAFRQQANDCDHMIIAPYFGRKHYRGYQRLEMGSAGYSSAEGLNKILHDVQRRYAVNTDIISLFGYSGGAQFAHRYAMLYPQRINQLIICSAGWYTFPDKHKNYPYGLKATQNFVADLSKNLPAFLQLRIRTLVGEFDNVNDSGLNSKERINRQQGHHRLERAGRWVHALQGMCNKMGLASDLRFITIKGCGHSFENCERLGNISRYMFTPDN